MRLFSLISKNLFNFLVRFSYFDLKLHRHGVILVKDIEPGFYIWSEREV